MTIVLAQTPADAVAVQANSIEVEALKLNAAAQQLRPTIAGVWDLESTTKDAPPVNDVKFLSHKNPGEESVLEAGDERVPVKPEDLLKGGKYRSILKLMMRYERMPNSFAHGTGWLIRPDLMVTAGHNVFNWSYNAGRVIEVKAYAGYNGRESIDDPKYQVEFRKGKRVVTTDRWLSSRGSKAFDVAFIQLDQPFTDITPIRYIETPPVGSLNIGVVGYPADIKNDKGEKGASMYEMFLDTNYNLATHPDTMLAYAIDTEGGNSGGPILRGSDLVALGAHVYGGDINSASVIGRYGNNYEDHIAAMRLDLPRPGLNLLQVSAQSVLPTDGPTGPRAKDLNQVEAAYTGALPAGATGVVNGKKVTNDVQSKGTSGLVTQPKPEGMFDFLRDVVDITTKAVPFLGPIAGPAISGPLFNVLSPMIAQNLRMAQTMGRPEGFFEDLVFQDMRTIAKRAQLADSALLAFYKRMFGKSGGSEESFIDDIARALKPVVIPVTNTGMDLLKSAFFTENVFDDVLGAIKGAPMAFLPFGLPPTILDRLQIPLQSYEAVVKDVSKILLQGFMLGKSPSTESSFDVRRSQQNGVSAAQTNEVQFAEAYAQTMRSQTQSAAKEELSWGDIGDAFKKAGNSITGATQDVEQGVEQGVGAVAGAMNVGWNDAANAVKNVPGSIFGALTHTVQAQLALRAASGVLGIAGNANPKIESAIDKSENIFEDAEAAISTVARAFVLRTVLADQLLNATMQQPTQRIKEEGLFDDLLKVVVDTNPLVQIGRGFGIM